MMLLTNRLMTMTAQWRLFSNERCGLLALGVNARIKVKSQMSCRYNIIILFHERSGTIAPRTDEEIGRSPPPSPALKVVGLTRTTGLRSPGRARAEIHRSPSTEHHLRCFDSGSSEKLDKDRTILAVSFSSVNVYSLLRLFSTFPSLMSNAKAE